jgi:hypothetical protein
MPDEQKVDQAVVEKLMDLQKMYLERASEVHFKPFVTHISEGVHRGLKLVQAAAQIEDKETSEEILRAVVVLNHAYLEDFLRNLALWLVPLGDEETLNKIPLVGTAGRSEKFQLGKLAQHRGKKIDAVIRESVAAHMERSTFNSVTEIMTFLASINVNLKRREEETKSSASEFPHLAITEDTLSQLEAMMKRRHHIVHRADKTKPGASLQRITEGEVAGWLTVTMFFTLSVTIENFMQRHSQAAFIKDLTEFTKVWDEREARRGANPPKPK